MEDFKFYNIVSICSQDDGSKKLLNLITNNSKKLINSDLYFKLENRQFKLFNLEIPSGIYEEYQPDEFLDRILRFLNLIGNQEIDLIMIYFPLNVLRLNPFLIRQTFRLLGRNSYNNILALLTNLDFLNDEARKEILHERSNSIHNTLKTNMVIVIEEDIIL